MITTTILIFSLMWFYIGLEQMQKRPSPNIPTWWGNVVYAFKLGGPMMMVMVAIMWLLRKL